MHKLPLSFFRIFLVLFGMFSGVSQAQVTTDQSVNTQVNSADQLNFEVNGGQQVGQNLFHSFDNFSVPTNGSALFNNPADITNIIGRVTGANLSNIDGIISAQGQANLFLINPNGITFGPNAQLNIGGSFLVSTADSIQFANGQEFSALNTQGAPLLAINMPIGFPIGNTSGSLSVLGSTLAVDQGQSLSLLGRDIVLTEAQLFAPGGAVDVIPIDSATVRGGFSSQNTTFTGGPSNGIILFEGFIVEADIPQDIISEPDFSEIGRVPGLIFTQRCRKKSQSKFVDTRRGGYPLTPAEIGSLSLSSWEDLRALSSANPRRAVVPTSTSSAIPIVEAQGWSKNSKGQIALVADTSNVIASAVVQAPAVCRS